MLFFRTLTATLVLASWQATAGIEVTPVVDDIVLTSCETGEPLEGVTGSQRIDTAMVKLRDMQPAPGPGESDSFCGYRDYRFERVNTDVPVVVDPDPGTDEPDAVDTASGWPYPIVRPDNLGDRGQYSNPGHTGPWLAPGQPSRMPTFEYVGAVRLDMSEDPINTGTSANTTGVSSSKHAFSVADDRVWVTNNRNHSKAFAAYDWKTPQVNNDVTQLPKLTRSIPFTRVPDPQRARTHFSGIFYDEVTGRLILNVREWYDADKSERRLTAFVNPDGTEFNGWYFPDGQMRGNGAIFKTPENLIDKIGGRLYMIPEHDTSIITSTSAGAGLMGITGDEPMPRIYANAQESDAQPLPGTNRIQYYSIQDIYGEHGPGGCGRPANPLFNRLSVYEAGFWMNGSYIHVGFNAGQETGVAYGNSPYNGQKGNYTCKTAEWSNNQEGIDFDNYFWIFDQWEVLNAENMGDPLPVEWGYLAPVLPHDIGLIKGAYFDPEINTLYLLSPEAGEYVIHVFTVS